MSFDNPYQAPEANTELVAGPEDLVRLRRIAHAQRQVNLAALLYFLLAVGNLAFSVAGQGSTWGMWVSLLMAIIVLGVLVLGATAVYRLAAIFRGRVLAVIYVLGLLIPLLGLVLLLSLSSRATKELRSAGVKVGLFGANPNALGSPNSPTAA